MATTKLSKEGKAFIRSKCKGSGDSKLSGNASDKGGYKYNPTGVLPYCSPLTTTSKQWTSNPSINGGVTTNAELGEALIRWYNKYAEEYEMDANIMAAQAYQESLWIIWNYAVNSSASGISQFVASTFYEGIMKNKRGNFTNGELIALTKNMIDYTYSSGTPPENPFLVKYELGKQNRPILHQNIIDNPEIMIKAQFEYMKHISTYCKGLASSTLFRYNRGLIILKVTSSYSEIINAAKNYSNNYENEGITYVYKIFKNLYENFGYTTLNINDEALSNFDGFNANLG